MNRILWFVIVAVFVVAGASTSIAATDHRAYKPYPAATSPQREADLAALKKWIGDEHGCESEGMHEVWINKLEYFDFKGDGKKELIVVASTCATGTGGPDIHSVFSRDGNGGFVELDIPEVDRKYYDGLDGNRNYDLSVDLNVESGLLVATWWDRSNAFDHAKSSPLVVKYKWHEGKFVVDSITAPRLKNNQ
jgi:hypothetical protein